MKNIQHLTLLMTLLLTIATPAAFASSSVETNNARVVAEFYETVFNKRDINGGIKKYMGSTYKQHNPYVADGPEGFRAGITYFLEQVMPKAKFDIVRTISQGDLVVVHVRVTEPGKADVAIIDIFRVENNRLVEHWDVSQEVPSKIAHNNTMF